MVFFVPVALDSTEDLDLQGLLATVGIAMRLRPATGPKDLGGWVERFDATGQAPPPQTSLAVRLKPGCGDAVIQTVLSGGAGERAGLAPGDTVIAVDGLRVTAESLERLVARGGLSRSPEGDGIRLHVFRRDELLELTARPMPATADTCELCLVDPEADPDAEPVAKARAAWLASLA